MDNFEYFSFVLKKYKSFDFQSWATFISSVDLKNVEEDMWFWEEIYSDLKEVGFMFMEQGSKDHYNFLVLMVRIESAILFSKHVKEAGKR